MMASVVPDPRRIKSFESESAFEAWLSAHHDSAPEVWIRCALGCASVLSWPEIVFGFAGATAVVVFIVTQRSRLIVMLVSPDVARTAGINVRLLNLLYLQAFALTIALGLRYLGVLLMGAQIIVPPATAKRLAGNLAQMLMMAVLVAVAATVVGSSVATWLQRETGPIVVSVAAACFLASLLRRQP